MSAFVNEADKRTVPLSHPVTHRTKLTTEPSPCHIKNDKSKGTVPFVLSDDVIDFEPELTCPVRISFALCVIVVHDDPL